MATIFPLSASVGQEFEGYIYDGTIWNLIGNEYNPTVYSAYEPDNPKPGDLWVDSSVDVPTFALNDYLTIASASSTYATKSELENIDALPSQTGNNGKFLTTDGASASWAIIDLSNYATQQYANNSASAAAAAIVDSAPETLNTLNELAAALNDDSNFATTVTNSLSNKLDISSASSTYLTQVNASNTYQTIVPNISNEEIGYLNNASANIQAQLNSKQSALTTYQSVKEAQQIFGEAAAAVITGLSASVTTTSSGQKVLINASIPGTSFENYRIQLRRDTAVLNTIETAGSNFTPNGSNITSFTYLDSPGVGTFVYDFYLSFNYSSVYIPSGGTAKAVMTAVVI